MSAELRAQPDSPAPSHRPDRLPSHLRRLFGIAPLGAAAAPIAYGVLGFLVAIQVQQIDPAAKVGNLAVINSLSAVAAMIAQPVFGALSDRTRSRWGSRHPWMIVGAAVGTVAMLTTGFSTSTAALVVCAMLVQFGYNAWQGPFSALLPDRVPERFRGRFSTLVGLGTLTGATIGPILGSLFAEHIPLGYLVIAGLCATLIALFLVLVPGQDNRGEPRRPYSARAFLSAFWVNPIRYPDFFWGFCGRILLFGGYYMLSAFNLYVAQDYIKLSLKEATALIPLLGLVALPGMLIAIAVSGPLSDRIGRRKPVVLAAGLIIATSAIIPFFVPTVLGLFLQSVLVAVGFGAFISVDQALMSSVLPDPEAFGKDLGVLNIAATLPGSLAPAAASVVVLLLGYGPLFLVVGVIATLGALAVLPIRSVR